jgi:transposase
MWMAPAPRRRDAPSCRCHGLHARAATRDSFHRRSGPGREHDPGSSRRRSRRGRVQPTAPPGAGPGGLRASRSVPGREGGLRLGPLPGGTLEARSRGAVDPSPVGRAIRRAGQVRRRGASRGAVTRPTTRSVGTKSVDRQALFGLHRTRDLAVRQRAQPIDMLRGAGRIRDCHPQGHRQGARIRQGRDRRRRAAAIAATVGSGHQFRSGREVAAGPGPAPRNRACGGRERLGRISRRGDRYLRPLLVVGITSRVRQVRNRSDRADPWLARVSDRKPPQRAPVATANRTARIIRAVPTGNRPLRPARPPRRAASGMSRDQRRDGCTLGRNDRGTPPRTARPQGPAKPRGTRSADTTRASGRIRIHSAPVSGRVLLQVFGMLVAPAGGEEKNPAQVLHSRAAGSHDQTALGLPLSGGPVAILVHDGPGPLTRSGFRLS